MRVVSHYKVHGSKLLFLSVSFSGRFIDTAAYEEIVVLLVICFIVYGMFMLNDCRSGNFSARVWAWDKEPHHAQNKACISHSTRFDFSREGTSDLVHSGRLRILDPSLTVRRRKLPTALS